MDLFLPIILCVVFFILFSICGWCCKKNQRAGIVYGYQTTPVTVTTTQVVTAQTAVPPYPIDATGHPMPYPGVIPEPDRGFGFSAPIGAYPPYSGAPGGAYPPYPPQPMGTTPYPPTNQLPPSYNEAVGNQQPSVTNEAYAKQAPYNPNY